VSGFLDLQRERGMGNKMSIGTILSLRKISFSYMCNVLVFFLLLVMVVVLGNIAEVEVVIAGGDGCD